MLKRKEKLSATSAHYRKQSPFKGSNRELRGQILRLLLANSATSEDEVIQQLNHSPVRIKKNLQQMQKEGFIAISGDMICIK
jgi:A/G-specific adenine glycosylase